MSVPHYSPAMSMLTVRISWVHSSVYVKQDTGATDSTAPVRTRPLKPYRYCKTNFILE